MTLGQWGAGAAFGSQQLRQCKHRHRVKRAVRGLVGEGGKGILLSGGVRLVSFSGEGKGGGVPVAGGIIARNTGLVEHWL